MKVRIYSHPNSTTAFIDNGGQRGDADFRIALNSTNEYDDFVEFLDTYFIGNLDHTYETTDPKVEAMFLLKFK